MLLESLRAAVAPVSLALTSVGYLRRGTTMWEIRLNPQSFVRPARAGQSGRSYDAKFRVHDDGRVTPMQNDLISADRVTWWTVWRVLPSPLGTHSFVECMAIPTDIVLPIVVTRVSDGMGGHVSVEQDDPSRAFAGVLSSANIQQVLTAQSESQMNRVALGYRVDEAELVVGGRLRVRGHAHTVLSLTTDDENPLWGRAVLARED